MPEDGRTRLIPATVATGPARRKVALAEHADRSEHDFLSEIDNADLAPLLDRIGDAKVVLLGEATHGTSEFYRMRERISRELIEKTRLQFRRHRGRLAGRGADRSLRAAFRVSAQRMDCLCTLSTLDVAQQ